MTTEIQEQIENVEEEEFAFDDAVKELFDSESDTSDEDTNSDNPTEEDKESSDETGDEEVVEDDDAQDDNTSDAETAEVDYRALYDQMTATNAALQADYQHKLDSYNGRLEAMQKEIEDNAKKETEKPVEADPELEEILDLYPDLIPQVQKIIDSKVQTEVSGVEDRVAQLIEQQVKPIASRVQESEAQAHEAAILKAHPDIRDLIASGQFRGWVETLPQYQQLGAQHICEAGTAEEVINLFDSFKQSTNISDASNKSPKQKKPAGTTNNNTNVDKLKAAMSVPSTPTKVSDGAQSTPENEDPTKLFAQAAKAIMQEESL